MNNFFARPRLSDVQFRQLNNDELTLSGTTRIRKSDGIEIYDAVNSAYLPIIVTGATEGDVLVVENNELVLKAGQAPLTFENGLTKDNNTVKLGGEITEPTELTLADPLRFIDNRATTLGVQYNGDYSSGFNNRSLVDKGYVDNAIANGLTLTITGASNGLEKVGQDAVLGGTLTQENTTITIENGTSFYIEDLRSVSKGLKYSANYSTYFTDRSLVDKGYVDAVATGLQPKAAVNVATTGNTTLSGLYIIDGIQLNDGDRVLVKDQTNASENGIYIASGVTWQRSEDFDGAPDGEVTQGALIPVLTGDTQANSSWILITEDPIEVGVDDLEFALFSALVKIEGGNGIGVEIVGNTNTIFISLGSDSGLDFNGGADLVINSDIAGSGLLWNAGVINIDVNDIPEIMTGATNGLYRDGRNVKLGGTLIENTTINASTFTFNISGDTSFPGIQYSEDYSVNFTNRSLVDKEYVDDSVSAITYTYENGLYDDGQSVKLGGDLIENTIISGNNNDLEITGLTNIKLSSTVINIGGAIEIEDVPEAADVSIDQVLMRNTGDKRVKSADTIELFSVGSRANILVVYGNVTLNNSYDTVLVSGTSAVTITLPTSPPDGKIYLVKDVSGNAGINQITVEGNAIDNGTTATINTNYGALRFVFSNVLNSWFVTGFYN